MAGLGRGSEEKTPGPEAAFADDDGVVVQVGEERHELSGLGKRQGARGSIKFTLDSWRKS